MEKSLRQYLIGYAICTVCSHAAKNRTDKRLYHNRHKVDFDLRRLNKCYIVIYYHYEIAQNGAYDLSLIHI